MKILKLTAENFKRLRAVEITPDPTTNLIQVRGRNGQGKSSVLDAIWAAVGGANAAPSKPVRNGEDKATIRLDLGDIIVTRRFTANGNGTDLRLEAADGARYTSPQTMLDKLIGAIAFDPLEFTRQKPKDQLESLRALTIIDADLDALDQQNATDYAARTEVNRSVTALRVRLESLPADPDPTSPAEPIDVQALTRLLAEASDHNTALERRRAAREQAIEQVATCRRHATDALTTDLDVSLLGLNERFTREYEVIDREISEIEARIVRLRERRAATIIDHAGRQRTLRENAEGRASNLTANADATQAKLDTAEPLPKPIDSTALAQEIDKANAINARILRDRQRTDVQNQLAEATTESERLTTQMQARIKQKADALAAATYPIPGLSLGEGEVLYNDVPLDQASQAEKIRVGVAVAIAANPKLHVIAIRDGSLLDTESLNLLTTLVTEADYQCWIEVTDDDAKIGVVIEDGSIAQPIAVGESSTTDEVLPL